MDSRIDFDVDEHKILLPHIICVEGNIGSGKSTLLSNLEKQGFRVIPEPVKHIWGQYLPRLYENLERWGCSFQMEVIDWFRQLQATHLHQEIRQTFQHQHHHQHHQHQHQQHQTPVNTAGTKTRKRAPTAKTLEKPRETDADAEEQDRIANIENIDPNPWLASTPNTAGNNNRAAGKSHTAGKQSDQKRAQGNAHQQPPSSARSLSLPRAQQSAQSHFIIVERSALSAFNIFCANLFESGLLTDWEHSLLKRWYSLVMWQPKYILYLRCDPERAIQRIHTRNRHGENKVDPKLIHVLHTRHESMFVTRYGLDAQAFKVDKCDYRPTSFPSSSVNTSHDLVGVGGTCHGGDNAGLTGDSGTRTPARTRGKNKPCIVYVDGNRDPASVLQEALTKIANLPIPEQMLTNVCKDCGTPRVQPRMLSFDRRMRSAHGTGRSTNTGTNTNSGTATSTSSVTLTPAKLNLTSQFSKLSMSTGAGEGDGDGEGERERETQFEFETDAKCQSKSPTTQSKAKTNKINPILMRNNMSPALDMHHMLFKDGSKP